MVFLIAQSRFLSYCTLVYWFGVQSELKQDNVIIVDPDIYWNSF